MREIGAIMVGSGAVAAAASIDVLECCMGMALIRSLYRDNQFERLTWGKVVSTEKAKGSMTFGGNSGSSFLIAT